MDDQLLDVLFAQLFAVEQVHIRIVIGDGIHLFLFPEVVYDQVVGNADHPRKEPAVIPVFPAAERLDHLNECFLKQILSQRLILDGKQNIGIHLAAVPVD